MFNLRNKKVFPLLLQVRGQSKTRETSLKTAILILNALFSLLLDHQIQDIQ
jgi:hypothetical protein